MPKREVIDTAHAPHTGLPYAQAIRYGDLVFVAGQVALDPKTNQPSGGDVAAQTRRVLDNIAVGRMILKPGWRWSTDVAPKMGTSTCQVRHLGAAVSGHLHVLVEDGSEMDIQAGDVYEIPPGHDGWVVGDVPWEAVEFASARVFGATEDETGVRSLGTILMTDIVGSTATLERVGDARVHSLLLAHHERLRAHSERLGGEAIRTTGDGFQVLFTGAARGVRCAAAMIDSLSDVEVQLRAGLHTGEDELAART